MTNTTDRCCGSSCDVVQRDAELKEIGATEFVEYLEVHLTEDCSPAAIAAHLTDYITNIHSV